MFSTRFEIKYGKIAALIYGEGDAKNFHRATEGVRSNPVVNRAALMTLTDHQKSLHDPGWYDGNHMMNIVVKAIVEFPYLIGQRIRISEGAKDLAGCYGEITNITADFIKVRLDGELAAEKVPHHDIAEGFEMTAEQTESLAEKLRLATHLYYGFDGEIRLQYADGARDLWEKESEKATSRYAAWRFLDTHYRSEWVPVSRDEYCGQVCEKRP